MSMSQDSAEIFALKAISWLAGNEDLLPVFLGASGTSEADIKDRVSEPEFLLSVLDFIMMDDAWVIEFCDTIAAPYERIMYARQSLPGGAEVSWT